MCETCAGSGTIFRVNEKVFPDTREGYDGANEAMNKTEAPVRLRNYVEAAVLDQPIHRTVRDAIERMFLQAAIPSPDELRE